MSDLDVRLLDAAPSLPATLARGVATGLGRPGASGSLPRHRLVLAGVEQDVRRLADYCDLTGGVLGDAVPVTWLHVLTFPLQARLMAGRDFPFPMLGMVHVANSMTQHRPVRVAEELVLSSWAEHLAPHRRGHTVDLVGEARVGEEVVWQGRSTYLARDKDGSGQVGGAQPATDRGEASAVRTGPAIPEQELATWRLPSDLGRRYAAVAGDANPIHLSALAAKAFGFPRAIAHGMWTHARALAAVAPRLPGAFRADVRFVQPVLLPSTVVLRGDRAEGMALAVTSRDGSRFHMSVQVSQV
ncbi:MaoC/PaaZ C-terminal domain-containing protein [Ornithinimicrobium avium]|uniref:MaoC/PaaZ C-terminal domain-containing protein n=1 Tax=Ornithinimicrobium avium TaxID=2283195 RepID=UPI0013B42509|nr:MaoC/PaaZ C-terminal domain-containing protein [Ornithinimicrobium avium]